ncbi:hypothetical protein F8388_019025 [Cannabis sativa]|uniref:Uncharacterized protein n=1 Tax=Cannabis sativa TaxID=3483 RepID=A0A7J6H0V5_CANSA|nr:hypothetical protein F8388_019025 [Cannabis sativa]
MPFAPNSKDKMACLSLARKQKLIIVVQNLTTLGQDNALIDCLLELSRNHTWRADCGFKNGYL